MDHRDKMLRESGLYRERKEREFTGASKIAEYLLKCSNCDAPLVSVLITQQSEDDQQLNFKADCPHCGDASFTKPIKGSGWYLGFNDYTNYTDFVEDGSTIRIRTVKGDKEYGKLRPSTKRQR